MKFAGQTSNKVWMAWCKKKGSGWGTLLRKEKEMKKSESISVMVDLVNLDNC